MLKVEDLKDWKKGINQVVMGDCLELMKKMPDKCVDLVLTDPPYGIGADKGVGGFGSSKTDKHYKGDWDNQIPSKEIFDEILRVGKKIVIWGGAVFYRDTTYKWTLDCVGQKRRYCI